MPALHVPVGVGVALDVCDVVTVERGDVVVVEVTVGLVELEVVAALVELVFEVVELAPDVVELAWLEPMVRGGVDVGVMATVPKVGVAEHVVTWSPTVNEFKPSG